MIMLVMAPGCKDTSAVHQGGVLETCSGLIDEQNWTEAISVCPDVGNDEGWHKTAQAYMALSGLSLFNLVNTLISSEDGATSSIFGYVPDTTADVNNYKAALDALLGTDAAGNPLIQEKTQLIYLESLLISSMLILKELKTLLGLELVGDTFTTCSIDSTTDACSFIPTIETSPYLGVGPEIPDKITFGGMGSDFYSGICGIAGDPSYDGTTVTVFNIDIGVPYGTVDVTIDHDVTADGCAIQVGSPLYYNKIANQGFTGEGFEITGLEVLDFYPMMDSGGSFSFEILPSNSLAFCNAGQIEPPGASDNALNDCEILAMFTDPSSDLF